MGMSSIGKFLEPVYVDVSFRFDQPSEEVQKIKHALCRGFSVMLTQVQSFSGSGGVLTEVLIHFVAIDGKAYRQSMKEEYGAYAGETAGECVMKLGTNCLETKRIMEAIAFGGDAYLIPDEGPGEDGVLGKYTLCYPAP